MAEDTEMPAENAPKSGIMPDQDTEDHKLEVRVNETESSMLEDETMPTYLSITSNMSSLKPDNSNIQPGTHDTNTDDEDIKSVYEVSSDDDRQGSSRARYVHRRDDLHDDNNDEDDEDDYEDSEDSRMNGRTGRMRYDDESDENEDEIENDEDDCVEDEEEGDSDGDIEPEQFERSSDDFVLRSSSTSLEKICKERSRSLQDLSPKKSSRVNNKRQGAIHLDHYGINPYPPIYNDSKQTPLSQSKYRHVPSKVKLYIEGIKEQSRQSEQRRSSAAKVDTNAYLVDIHQRHVNQETDNVRLNPQCRRLKNLNEYPMGAMMEEMVPRNRLVTSINIAEQIPPIVNGGNVIPPDTMKQYEQTEHVRETMETDNVTSQEQDNCGKQFDKPNGTIDYPSKTAEFEHNGKLGRVPLRLEPSTDNHRTAGPIIEIGTLTYEDYMKSNVERTCKSDEVEKKTAMKFNDEPSATVHTFDLLSVPSPIQTENVVTEELLIQSENHNDMICDDKPLIELMKSHMDKNITDYTVKTDDYQKVLDENLKLKKEIKELKQFLANHDDNLKRKEMKIVAVQTEDSPRILKHTSTSTHLQLPNKLSTGAVPEIGSTISSIEQWTDSEYNPSISLKPPNVEHLLNSDDGTSEASPKYTSQATSRALWTTNRILQTLANMTPSRPVPNILNEKFDGQGQSKDIISPLITGGRISRKRKASDNRGTSTFGPVPSKIPSINTIDARRKFNSTSNTDGAVNSAGLPPDIPVFATDANQRVYTSNEHELPNYEDTDDDGVKCFVWHEDEDSQERSCLIQAPVGLEGTSRSGESKKPVRECGPYLLGNLEVRISEANGTLNIWGKEVSEKSKSQESEGIDENESKTINDPDNFWPKTPRTMVDNHFKCSTTKKMKTPASVRGNLSRHLRGILNRTPSPANAQVGNHLDEIPVTCQRGAMNCNQCHSNKRLSSPTCNNHLNAQVQQSCLRHKPDTNVHDCNCRRDHEPIIENGHCSCGVSHQHAFPSSNYKCHCDTLKQNHVCVNHLSADVMCKHAAACHRLSDSESEDCCSHIPRRQCNSAGINSRNYPSRNGCCQEGNLRQTATNACTNELLSRDINSEMNFEKSYSVPEKRQRHRGKRVRNIMGFLRGCGDCRNPETSSIDSCQIPGTETTNTRSIPSIRLISDTPSTPSYSKHSNNSKIQKECSSCAKHASRAAELVAELEIIRVEISKLHSRSNVMRDMLHRVLQADLDIET